MTKKNFNYRLSRVRRYIECTTVPTFKILSNKWRIFHRTLNVKLDLAQIIIKACCILHNFVRVRDGYRRYRYDDTLIVQGLENIENINVTRGSQTAQTVRDSTQNIL